MQAPTEGSYVEIAPDPRLGAWVECFWVGRPGDARVPARILPDGCTDIVLQLEATSPGAMTAARAEAVGTMTRPLIVMPDGQKEFVGVRFRPGRARAVFGIPASELTDLSVEMGELWRDSEEVLEPLLIGSTSARIGVFQRLLLARLERASPPPREVEGAVRALLRTGGNLSIAALGPALGVTRQHLARRFTEWVGTPPKMFARVVRARRVLALARAAHAVDWSKLALDAGYYDQSHLAAELKELTGLPPREWVGTRSRTRKAE